MEWALVSSGLCRCKRSGGHLGFIGPAPAWQKDTEKTERGLLDSSAGAYMAKKWTDSSRPWRRFHAIWRRSHQPTAGSPGHEMGPMWILSRHLLNLAGRRSGRTQVFKFELPFTQKKKKKNFPFPSRAEVGTLSKLS